MRLLIKLSLSLTVATRHKFTKFMIVPSCAVDGSPWWLVNTIENIARKNSTMINALHSYSTPGPGGTKSIAMSMSVCLSARITGQPHTDERHQIFCNCCPWLRCNKICRLLPTAISLRFRLGISVLLRRAEFNKQFINKETRWSVTH